MDSNTGKDLSGIAHLMQSIRDILTTPIGSRVMRRDYGSRLFSLIDNPLNAATNVEIYAATAEALMRWEPRISVRQVQAYAAEAGKIVIDLAAIYLPTGEPVQLDGILIS
jgi:uncharacterized protein